MKHSLTQFLLGGALLLSSLGARAQTPGPIGQIISYQGQLSDTAGKPVADASQSLTFKIYEGGVEKSSQTIPVQTIGGVFNAFLSVGTLVFDPAKAYELGITFNGMETRQPIAAVPVALTAKSAAGVSGVVPVANGGTGSSAQNFVDLTTAQTVAGAKTFGSAVTVPQVNIGAGRVLGTSPNGKSVFLGPNAGAANGNTSFNVLLGGFAGLSTTGDSNVFVGESAGLSNTTGAGNTALGDSAGGNWTTGNSNIAIGNAGAPGESNTIRIGTSQTGAFIAGIRGVTGLPNALPVVVNPNGQLGTGTAASLGLVDTTSAQTVAGAKTFSSALTAPQFNIGVNRVLGVNFNGSSVFVGPNAGAANGNSTFNVLVGAGAGGVNTGGNNALVGAGAGGSNTTGQLNTALGTNAGGNWTTGSSNIAIGSAGVAGEGLTTRIGTNQTRAFISGINGVAVAGSPVIIDSNGQLGTVNSSSARFKQDVQPLGAKSDWLLKLRPVSFRYTPAFLKSATPSPVQYGLIAEEVAKVAPQMVHLDAQGRPDGVDYQSLPVMLLSQIQQQQKLIKERDAKIAALKAKNATFEARLKKLEAGR